MILFVNELFAFLSNDLLLFEENHVVCNKV